MLVKAKIRGAEATYQVRIAPGRGGAVYDSGRDGQSEGMALSRNARIRSRDGPRSSGSGLQHAKSLGWDVTKSWLNAYLYVEGIQNIELESPLDDLLVADDACTALKSCELTLAGRTW